MPMIDQETYELVIHPDKKLRKKALPVKDIDQEVVGIAKKMLTTMRGKSGIGLAAPQVGVSKRVIVIEIPEEKVEAIMIANPKIKKASEEKSTHEEGCLSVPGVVAPITRPAKVSVEAINIETGEKIEIEAESLLATCIQHEIDHLDGILFFDHLTRLRRSRLLRQYKKLLKEGEDKEEQAA